jgi:hypothetical protein
MSQVEGEGTREWVWQRALARSLTDDRIHRDDEDERVFREWFENDFAFIESALKADPLLAVPSAEDQREAHRVHFSAGYVG